MGELLLISIGLYDEKDMSLRALEEARKCDKLYLEMYTTVLGTTKEKLEDLIGKEIKVVGRKELEEGCGKIVEEARRYKVGVLVGGDCLVATTHNILREEAMKKGVRVRVVHGSSILSAVAETGLHIYKFGRCVTIPLPEKTGGKIPFSVYDVIKGNKERGLHTLCLLDVDMERNRKLSVDEAARILLEMENKRKEGVVDGKTKVVVYRNFGKGSEIIYLELNKLLERNVEPPAVLIIPGKLHFTEEDFLQNFIS